MHCASNLVLEDGEGSPEEGALELESEEGLSQGGEERRELFRHREQ